MAENRELALVLKLVADQFQSELKKSGGLIGDFQKIIGDWRTQLTAAGGALFAIAKSTANYGDELVKMSQRIGVSIADTARLQHAAKLADTDLQGLSSSIGFLSKNMLAAAQGGQEQQQMFARLGISVTTAQGQLKGTTEILTELSERFQRMPEGPEKTALAMQVLGKTGKDVLPFLNSQLGDAFKEAEQLGLVMSDADAKAAERFNDELTKLQASMRGLLIQGSGPLIESLTQLSEMFRTLTGNELVKGFFRGLAEQTVLFSNVVKQAAANVEFLFGKLSFDELKTKIKGLEAEAGAKLLLLENPAAAEFVNGPKAPARPSGGRLGSYLTDDQRGKEQERLGKAKLEIFLMQNRALEIQARLLSEIEDAGIQESLGRFGVRDAQQKVAEQLEDAQIQESLGRRIVQETQALVAGREQEQLGRQIIQQTQAELSIREQLRQESMTFFDAWTEGMRKYVKDTQSGFGLSADMARRTFQTMEQGASRFFFDVMDGKITSLKDAFAGLLDFVKQAMAQIASQLLMRSLTSGLAGLGTSFLGGSAASLFGGIGGVDVSGVNVSANKFASGGSFIVGGNGGTDTTPVGFMATRGERVTVETPDQQRSGAVTVIVNNYGSNEVQTSSEQGSDGRQMIYVTIRDMVKGMVNRGDLDRAFNQRWNLSPSAGGR